MWFWQTLTSVNTENTNKQTNNAQIYNTYLLIFTKYALKINKKFPKYAIETSKYELKNIIWQNMHGFLYLKEDIFK